MNIITQARYRFSRQDDFSNNILVDATEISHIKKFFQEKNVKNINKIDIEESQYYEIELNDIRQHADHNIRNKWNKGERIYFQIIINHKYILETKSAVSFYMTEGSSSIFAKIMKNNILIEYI